MGHPSSSVPKPRRWLSYGPQESQPKSTGFVVDSGRSSPSPLGPECSMLDVSANDFATLPAREGPGLPLSTWAQLSFIKHQRDVLRSELEAEHAINTRSRASISNLRRLAFRQAINITIRDDRIAHAAKRLANAIKRDYIAGRDAETKIETLTRCWKDEERRNREILESLEKATSMTLQYADTSRSQQDRLLVEPISPPPSPPARSSSLNHHPASCSKAHLRTHASSAGLESHATGNETPSESDGPHISTGRLLNAKRESDRALSICRSRIATLHAECLQSKESAKLLEAAKQGLEDDIRSYQARTSSLKSSEAELKASLRSTQAKLVQSIRSEAELEAELACKSTELESVLVNVSQDHADVAALEHKKSSLAEDVRQASARLQEHEETSKNFREEVDHLQALLDAASHRESAVQSQLASNISLQADREHQLQKKQAIIASLKASVNSLEAEVEQHRQRDNALQSCLTALKTNHASAEQLRTKAEVELQSSQASVAAIELDLLSAREINAALQMDLENTRRAKGDLEKELEMVRDELVSGADAHTELQIRVDALEQQNSDLVQSLTDAHARMLTLEPANVTLQGEIDSLRAAKASLQTEHDAARKSSSGLEMELQASEEKLAAMESSIVGLQTQHSKSQTTDDELREQLAQMAQSKVELGEHFLEQQESNGARQGTISSTKSPLPPTDAARTSLEAKLSMAEGEIQALRQINAELEESRGALTASLKSAEAELDAVRRANLRLETFLDKAERDMTAVETSIFKSKQHLDLFMEQSSTRLSAAERSKRTYKRLLTSRDKDFENLQRQKSELSMQIERNEHNLQRLRDSETRLQTELESREAALDVLRKMSPPVCVTSSSNTLDVVEEGRVMRVSHTLDGVLKSLQDENELVQPIQETTVSPGEAVEKSLLRSNSVVHVDEEHRKSQESGGAVEACSLLPCEIDDVTERHCEASGGESPVRQARRTMDAEDLAHSATQINKVAMKRRQSAPLQSRVFQSKPTIDYDDQDKNGAQRLAASESAKKKRYSNIIPKLSRPSTPFLTSLADERPATAPALQTALPCTDAPGKDGTSQPHSGSFGLDGSISPSMSLSRRSWLGIGFSRSRPGTAHAEPDNEAWNRVDGKVKRKWRASLKMALLRKT